MIENRFIADDRRVFRLSLSDEHPVERVFVKTRQEASANTMLR